MKNGRDFMYSFLKTDGCGISEEILLKIEQKNAMRFPAQLRLFYLEHNGAEIMDTDIQQAGESYNVNCFIYPSAGIVALENLLEERVKFGCNDDQKIPFAADMADNLFYWDKQDSKIYFCTYDSDEFILVCKNMNEFFELMKERNTSGMSFDTNTYLPLGSVVRLNGGLQKLLVIARALKVKNEGKEYFFDYAGVPYPEGLTGDQIAYFNHDQLAKVIFEGYRDEDDAVVLDNIRNFLNNNPQLKRFHVADKADRA